MNTVVRILRSIGRFLRDTGIPILVQLGRALIRLSRRFSRWWLKTFRARGRRGKLVFGAVSLLGACCLCSIPLAVVAPAATPTPPAPTLAVAAEEPESEAVTGATAARSATPIPTDTPQPTETATATDTAEPTETAVPPTETPAIPAGETATVVEIIDGDTIDVEIDGQVYRVRYIGMDTPERGALFFEESTEANRQLVEAETVTLVKDVSQTDRFGRLLRYVYLEDGTFVNAELVALGYALVATFPPDVRHQDLYLELEQEAREAGRGLWAQPTATLVPPTWTPAPATATSPPAATNTPAPQPTAPPPPPPTPTAEEANCDPAYPTVCIPSPPPDLNCPDIPYRNFTVLSPDPHGFDGDNDGIGCES